MSKMNHFSNNNEIDLFSLVSQLWNEKILVLSITLFFLAIGSIVTFLKKPAPIYQAYVNLSHINSEDKAKFDSIPFKEQLIPTSSLDDFIKTINSSSVKQNFIDTAQPSIKSKLYPNTNPLNQQSSLNRMLSYASNTSQSKAVFPYTVSFTGADPTITIAELERFMSLSSSSLLNNYKTSFEKLKHHEVAFLGQKIKHTHSKIQREVDSQITQLIEANTLKKQRLEIELQAAKSLYTKKLNDKRQLLEEAYRTAETLKIENPIILSELRSPTHKSIILNLNEQGSPLYLRGTELLAAEIHQLNSRKPDFYPDHHVRELENQILKIQTNPKIELLKQRKTIEPYSKELTTLTTKLEQLQSEEFPKNLTFDFRASPAMATLIPVKNKNKFTVALSTLLGLFLGILAAITKSTIKSRESNEPASQDPMNP